MVNHDVLHRQLADFVAALTADFDLTEALHQVATAATAALGVDGAGITLSMPSGDTQYVTATDAVALRVERAQDDLSEGACVDAITTSEVVAAGDLSTETRWPRFTPVLLGAGFHGVAGVPIRFQGQNIGAVNLYTLPSRSWTAEEFAAGRLVADLAGGYLVNSHLRRDAESLAGQLQQALSTRIIIEQAKGVLAGRHAMTPDAAFEILRIYARSNRTKIHDIARAVVTGDLDPVRGLDRAGKLGG